jgi:hypothetical protein
MGTLVCHLVTLEQMSLFGQVLGVSPNKLWPVSSGPWYLL